MKYKKIFKVIFQKFPDDCDSSILLSDLNFDSMSQILLISELEANYNTIIEPSELEICCIFRFNYLSGQISKN